MRCTMGMVLGALALLGGCGNDAKPARPVSTATASATTAPTAAPEPALRVAMGDKSMRLDNAYVVSGGTSALTLVLSERAMDCDDVKPARARQAKDHRVELTLAHKLMPDGKRKWVIARGKGYGFGEQTLWDDRKKPGAVNVATASAQKGLSASIDIELGHKSTPSKLKLTGDVLAKGCGVLAPQRPTPPANAQPGLKLTVAGQSFEVKGAKLTLEKDRKVLDLTTAPQDCKFNAAGEIGFSLGLRNKGGSHAFLRGDAIQNNLNTSGEVGIEAKIGKKDGDRQVVELKGKTTLFDYEVVAEGQVKAIICDNR